MEGTEFYKALNTLDEYRLLIQAENIEEYEKALSTIEDLFHAYNNLKDRYYIDTGYVYGD